MIDTATAKKIEEIVRDAGMTLLSAHLETGEVHQKDGPANFVTDYDVKIQAQLIRELSRVLPGCSFFGEEDTAGNEHRVGESYTFFIDPIDGTMNFVHGFGHSCISTAYMHEGMIEVGVIFNPYRDELFSAIRGQGAFLNGRLNLSQTEAVADLINSTSKASNQLAISQLRGGYQQKLQTMRQELLELTALLELELDFSQEDVEFADRSRLMALTQNIEDEAQRLVESFCTGNAVKNGVKVAIIGEPNVGKSTLLNALLDDDRAIVSDIPGTTRDTIEDTAAIDGILVRFIDTAGLRQSDDPIEAAGIERSRKAAQEADVMIYVKDATDHKSTPNIPDTQATIIVALNKCDLLDHINLSTYQQLNTSIAQHINISAKTGTGLKALKQAIVAPFKTVGDTAVLTNLRHYDAMRHLLNDIRLVKQGLEQQTPSDLVAIDLRDAIHHIGEITGEVTTDEILGTIFSRFCVGK